MQPCLSQSRLLKKEWFHFVASWSGVPQFYIIISLRTYFPSVNTGKSSSGHLLHGAVFFLVEKVAAAFAYQFSWCLIIWLTQIICSSLQLKLLMIRQRQMLLSENQVSRGKAIMVTLQLTWKSLGWWSWVLYSFLEFLQCTLAPQLNTEPNLVAFFSSPYQ